MERSGRDVFEDMECFGMAISVFWGDCLILDRSVRQGDVSVLSSFVNCYVVTINDIKRLDRKF